MAAEIKVVFVDEGTPDPRTAETADFVRQPGPSAGDSTSGPRRRWRGEPAAEGSAAATSGPQRQAKESESDTSVRRKRSDPSDESKAEKPPQPVKDDTPTAAEGAMRAAEIIARALGAGQIVSVVKTLADSFSELWKAVNKSTEAHETNASAVEKSSGAESASGGKSSGATGPRAGEPEVIDAEFEVKNPVDIPKLPGPRALKPYNTAVEVETIAINGPKAAQAAGAAGAAATAGAGEAAGGLAALSAAAGPAAIAVAAVAAAAVAGAVAVKKLVDVLAGEADRLSNYSAELSGATARSDIRAELADIRRASAIGPQLAKFETMRSRFEEKIADINTAMLEALLRIIDKMDPIIEAALKVVETTADNMPKIIAFVEFFMPIILQISGSVGEAAALAGKMVNILSWLLAIEQDKEDEDVGPDPFLAAFNAAVANMGGPPRAPAPAGGGVP